MVQWNIAVAIPVKVAFSIGTRPKLQIVCTILCNHCCAHASKLHAWRRKSPRQSLTAKPNLFIQRVAVACKTHTKSLKHFFSLYICHSHLEICTEVSEWETSVYTYSRYDWILVMWRFLWPVKAFRVIKWLLKQWFSK